MGSVDNDREEFESVCKRAKRFIYRNARPIDLARWRYHFENESADAVLEALGCYQNSNGGFAYGLEPDFWNPHSSPVQTWEATEILWEIGMEKKDADRPLIQGILDYLSSGRDFEDGCWLSVVESNNKYPHADWWHYPHPRWWKDTAANRFAANYNPTVALAGFILYFEEPGSEFYETALQIAKQAVSLFLKENVEDMHLITCFVRLYEYIVEADLESEFPMDDFEKRLKQLVRDTITQDENLYITQWSVNICRPSQYFRDSESMFYKENKKIADFECEFISKTQGVDGSWEITWNWGKTYMEAWGLAKNWWKSNVIIRNLLYWSGIKDF